jgi:two-component system, LytTR family, response regulator
VSFTAYIAEDEPLAREALVAMLTAAPGWRVIGSAGDGKTALVDCLREPPDLLVTDIKMPKLDGLELCAALRAGGARSILVFVTAYAQHGVDAFRLAATDYLLKPVDGADLARCLERVETALRGRLALDQLEEAGGAADEALKLGAGGVERLVVRSVGRVDIVPLRDVIAFKAERNYVDVVTEERTWMHRETMKSLADRLDKRRFLQIHRSVIVATARVRGIERDGLRASVLLDDGSRYPVGASYVAIVERTFEI